MRNLVREARDPCPPHVWEDKSDLYPWLDIYLLVCAKCKDRWPDEQRVRGRQA